MKGPSSPFEDPMETDHLFHECNIFSPTDEGGMFDTGVGYELPYSHGNAYPAGPAQVTSPSGVQMGQTASRCKTNVTSLVQNLRSRFEAARDTNSEDAVHTTIGPAQTGHRGEAGIKGINLAGVTPQKAAAPFERVRPMTAYVRSCHGLTKRSWGSPQ